MLGMAVLVVLAFSAQAFAQTATITGTVTDASGGVLQGAKITITNEATNVKQETTTNNAGVYNLNLPAGSYTVVAEMASFTTQTKREIRLNTSSQLRLNIEMTVKELKAEVIDVNVKSQNLILESGSTIGVVIPEDQISKLPIVNNNVMSLVQLMGGTVMITDTYNQIFGADSATMAGLSARNVNITKDGNSITDVRNPIGFNAPVNLNPDLIGEFKVVMQPVDAELGRGSGQIQIVTRSGANAYHGSANWNVQNTAFNASEWSANKSRIRPTWANRNDISANVGGPIIKNKTFFFVLFDWNTNLLKMNNVNINALTPCARKGIYRYFDGYTNGNFLAVPADAAATSLNRSTTYLNRRVVNGDGSPVTGLPLPSYVGGTYTGDGVGGSGRTSNPNPSGQLSLLRAYSPFGPIQLSKIAPAYGGTGTWDPRVDINCNDVQVDSNGFPTPAWVQYSSTGTSFYDSYRGPDQSGYVGRFFQLTQNYTPNNYDVGDGLNRGGYRWTRRMEGNDNSFGIGENPNRKQINIRIDHNFTPKQRLSVSYTYERDKGDDNYKTLPTGFGGRVVRYPHTLSGNLTSTLRPNFLNELRIGFTRNNAYTMSSLQQPDTGQQLQQQLYDLLPTASWPGFQGVSQDIPVIVSQFNSGFSGSDYHPYGTGRGAFLISWGTIDNRWSYADTATLTIGRHSLRIGGETQRISSKNSSEGIQPYGPSSYPIIYGGSASNAAITGFYNPALGANAWTLPGTVGNSNTAGNMGGISSLLDLYSGSVSSVTQAFFVNRATDTKYNNIASGETWLVQKYMQNQFNWFIQDNWRVTDDLTLNLGMRYEWYGVPYMGDGMTPGFVGGNNAAFGLTGRSFKNWMNLDFVPTYDANGFVNNASEAYKNCTDNTGAKATCQNSQLIFIGPGSPNPGVSYYNNDNNNFGPVFGFAYSLPWGGKGKTVLRGGMQINYLTFARAGGALSSMPGIIQSYTHTNNNNYMNLTSVSSMIPLTLPSNYIPPAAYAGQSELGGALSQRAHNNLALTFYDPGIRTPYTESLNLILTRTIGSSLTLDVRYAGNLSHKQMVGVNINSPNYLSTGLLSALKEARAGGNPALLDKYFWHVNIAATPGYGPVGTTVNGVYQSAAMQLRANTANGLQGMLASGSFSSLVSWMGTANVNTTYNPTIPAAPVGEYGQILRYAGQPDNIITANPQFGTVTYNANFNNANYHSMQAQITMRPTHGLGFSGTYTFSKSMGNQGFSDFGDRNADYGITGGRAHALTAYGTFDLPFGPNRWLLSNTSPNILGRIIGGWQLSFIQTYNTGTPSSITGASYLWSGSMPNKVGPFDNKSGYISWMPGATTGEYFGGKYSYAQDPQCLNPKVVDQTPAFRAACSLYATTLAANPSQFIFVNALPGERGNFQRNQVMNVGYWNTDAAASKTVKLTEGKSLSLRVDTTNVFNHVMATGPAMSLGNGVLLGRLTSKGGNTAPRKFQARVRIDF